MLYYLKVKCSLSMKRPSPCPRFPNLRILQIFSYFKMKLVQLVAFLKIMLILYTLILSRKFERASMSQSLVNWISNLTFIACCNLKNDVSVPEVFFYLRQQCRPLCPISSGSSLFAKVPVYLDS